MLSPRFHHFDEVGSTNDVALEMAQAGEPEGAVVVARRQLEGRGRRGSRWWDEPGQSLLMSVILAPGGPVDELPRLSFVASLGVAECLQEVCGLDACVKWPNDVMVGGKKIAGLLVEVAVLPRGSVAVVGIGLNVNQTSFPDELADTATSISIETGRTWDVERITVSVAEHVFSEYDAGGFADVLRRWRERMWGVGARVEVTAEGRVVSGIMRGVDSTGALVVGDDDGNECVIHAADGLRVVGESSR
ncbi:MAG: biotin--[acetyl-CoA-carboxylase] ligase [Armatimonadetes bacterium RBG_16_58_9]|nr:MAG: biotin--[acetyl-CoA-carboxylase] ligase [Armatimonadetes bacterium RBG_16_58_9]